MLEDHGNRFVCVLYFLSRGVGGRPFDSDRVYSELQMKGFTDQQQARAELVQFLETEGLVEYNRANNTVNLTLRGLERARRHCDEPLYGIYRHLQN